MEINVFNFLTSFHRTMPKNVDGFGLAIPKLRGKLISLFQMSSQKLFKNIWNIGTREKDSAVPYRKTQQCWVERLHHC